MVFVLESQLISFEKDLMYLWPCEGGMMMV